MGTPWAAHRGRAEALAPAYPYASELLTVYLALVDVWDEAWRQAREERPGPSAVAGWAAERVAPSVVKAAEATGPEPLATGVRELLDAGGLEACCAVWLAGGGLDPVERFLARACLTAPLVALGDSGGTGDSGNLVAAACAADPAPRGDTHCPRCGGPPQVSVRGDGDEPLKTGRRTLLCARCAHAWPYSNSTCPSCGETTGSQRTLYAERSGDGARTPHLRIDACATCRRYLIDVDAVRDARAVPEVDELVALPLDLYAAEQGLTKITPNILGF
jgi:FdhE protein